MALPQEKRRYTPQEYYELERDATYKSDYYEGEIWDMSGGTMLHSRLSSNINFALSRGLENSPCQVFESNFRLRLAPSSLRCYPDVSVYCGPIQYDSEDTSGTETAMNPTVIVEVLSKSTEGYDRGLKSENFRRIASLKSYVFVSQVQPHVEVYERQAGGWMLHEFDGLDASVSLDALKIEIPMREIYARVDFSGETPKVIS